MVSSKQLAGLVGPAIVAMIASEFPLVQPHLYDEQIPPVVYLSGVLMFVAGLAIARAHNRWAWDWTVLVTITGWFAAVLGLFRMFAAGTYQRGAANTPAAVFMALEIVLLLCGLVMTFKAYRRDESRDT
jgi:FtsH-binding integral membrane protein